MEDKKLSKNNVNQQNKNSINEINFLNGINNDNTEIKINLNKERKEENNEGTRANQNEK